VEQELHRELRMPKLDHIVWAAITFINFNYNASYMRILGRESFLKRLRESPQEITVYEVRDLLVQFLNDWGCRLRNYDDVTASKLKDCIISAHSDLVFFRKYSILEFDFEDRENNQKIIDLFNKFWTFSTGSQIGSNFGSTATSKTLHILNPNLFTMWDDEIRYRYGFIMGSGSDYLKFLQKIKEIGECLADGCRQRCGVTDPALWLSGRLNISPAHTLTKFIDEFNWLTCKRGLSKPPDWSCPF
jgi:hypothetical protein